MYDEILHKKPFNLQQPDINWVRDTIGKMTLEEKIGQLFCLQVPVMSSIEELRGRMAYKPGGFMLRPLDTQYGIDVVNMINSNTDIPLLLAADLEKGGNGVSDDGTTIGSPLSVAATNDVGFASKLGTLCAREGAAMGLNWIFGPIVDIDRNFLNPITNVRTFGSDPDRIKAMGTAFVEAVQDHGLAASCKHFPGDGIDFRDQHIVGSVNSLSADEWESSFGEIYRTCIEAGTMTIMAGHITLPAWSKKLNPNLADRDILPASLSPELLQGLLRGHLGFNGLIVTDATTMTGFMQALPRPQLVEQVFIAGCDVLLFTTDLEADFAYLLDGVKQGRISEERLTEALIRILGLKAALGLHKSVRPADFAAAKLVLGCDEHLSWAKECADRSITLVKEEPGVLPLSPKKYKRVLYIPLEGKPDEFSHNRIRSGASMLLCEMLKKEGFDVSVLSSDSSFFPHMRSYSYVKDNFDLILYCANYGTTANQTTVRIAWPKNNMSWCPNFVHSVPNVFISLENPYHLMDVPRVRTYINTYSPNDRTIEMLHEKLMGRSEFMGVSPVDAFCGLWDARL